MKSIKVDLNSFFMFLIIFLFLLITLGSLSIAKRGMHSVFSNQADKYFDQSANFIETMLNEKMQEVEIATKLVHIPQDIVNTPDKKLQLYLKDSVNEYVDFFVFLPRLNKNSSIVEGQFLYDIKPLQNYLEKNIASLKNENFIKIETKDDFYGFLLYKKRIIDSQSGQVLGALVGGVELGFQSTFLNKIKKFTNLQSVILFSENKTLGSLKGIPKEQTASFFKLIKDEEVSFIQHRELKLNENPIGLKVAMKSKSNGFNTIRQQLKRDLTLFGLLIVVSVLFLVLLIRFFLVRPILSLKNIMQQNFLMVIKTHKKFICA